MGWWSYYLFWMLIPGLLALVSRHPGALVVVVIALVLRRWLPDPVLFFRYLARVSSLRGQIAANPQNAAAKRELAMIFLRKRRPRQAVPLVEQALERDPESAELHFLLGVARLESGDPERALESFGETVRLEEKHAYGEAYLRAGDAFLALGKLEQATQALSRYLEINRSSIEGMVKRARVLRRAGDAAGAKRSLEEAVETWGQVPSFLRRRQLGWYLRARWDLLLA